MIKKGTPAGAVVRHIPTGESWVLASSQKADEILEYFDKNLN